MRYSQLPTGRRSILAMAFAALVTGASFPWPALAQTAPARLTAEQQADVERMQAYLSGIRTMQARFVQVASNGAYAEGTFYLSRPGKLRFQYDPPAPLLIISDGTVVYSYDTALKQTTQIPVNLTPLWFLLRERISFTGDVTLTRYDRQAGVVRLTLVQTKDPAAGSVELALQSEPLALRQWSVTDGQGITTNIALTEARQDVRLDGKLFVFNENQPGGVQQHQ
ncbi:outer membrane lipoprotein-sorting protein [Stella humosa]|uniref:Outer membrane lipoprotein-sorting protein n=1 Tax=Stella humosa TaxID=94 RepID=A0A3N1LI12_9PROT|nr:outer membrane lipoprotein carrier protein LolA [Stella humosa]ROP90910.1 outer membrane lipoprotein-sorting protein [Stella humosa]BBK34740.1 outer-membrane lipoprotein carrier protein [Stella humosa]